MLNKCAFIGNLTKDPELRFTPSGDAICTFSIACNEKYKNKQGEQQEVVEYVNVVAWRQLAEICGKYLVKGKQIYIDGKMKTRSYDDRDGNKKYITEIVANDMKMLGSKNQDGGQRQDRPKQNSQQQQQNNGQQGQATGGGGHDQPPFDPDNDIPF